MSQFFGSGMPLYDIRDEGFQAYKDGKEFWECPHVQGSSNIHGLSAWIAGWMAAKQLGVKQEKLEKSE